MSSSTTTGGPTQPPNSALRIQRIPINVCVNHPVGAPQFAAISSVIDLDDNKNADPKQQHVLIPSTTSSSSNTAATTTTTTGGESTPSSSSSSLFTAFPHDRGAWNGLVLERSNNNTSKKVQCFSTWAAPESYKKFLALNTAGGDLSDDEQEDNEDDLPDEDDANDDDDGVDNNNNSMMNDGDDDNDGAGNKKKRKNRGGNYKKKGHSAFRRVPERRPEAWFVLSESQNSTAETTSYDMLPLMEVFSCQKREFETDKQQDRAEGKAPRLYFSTATRAGNREERKEDRREAKMDALREQQQQSRRRPRK